MDIKKRLIEIFESVGIFISDEADMNEDLEIDSIQFVTLIIEIEEQFMLRISNDFEEYSELTSFNAFFNLVNSYFVD